MIGGALTVIVAVGQEKVAVPPPGRFTTLPHVVAVTAMTQLPPALPVACGTCVAEGAGTEQIEPVVVDHCTWLVTMAPTDPSDSASVATRLTTPPTTVVDEGVKEIVMPIGTGVLLGTPMLV
jgi:hypothetical protein